jgi:hypothetical protein
MSKLEIFLSTRPGWFKREWCWRQAQVLRLGPPVAFLVFAEFGVGKTALSVLMGSFEEIPAAAGIALAWTVGAVVYVSAIHWLLRLVVWIVDRYEDADPTVR